MYTETIREGRIDYMQIVYTYTIKGCSNVKRVENIN